MAANSHRGISNRYTFVWLVNIQGKALHCVTLGAVTISTDYDGLTVCDKEIKNQWMSWIISADAVTLMYMIYSFLNMIRERIYFTVPASITTIFYFFFCFKFTVQRKRYFTFKHLCHASVLEPCRGGKTLFNLHASNQKFTRFHFAVFSTVDSSQCHDIRWISLHSVKLCPIVILRLEFYSQYWQWRNYTDTELGMDVCCF